mmetsp:Transcript_55197/g.176903  ORF Transcript_55197/g.176903 Transcript_55197/m.176903 type:complete len:290 (-) Transcript_55197:123-992(-)
MDALPLRLMIKNTFLEATACDALSDAWRRQVSEPVKVPLHGNTTPESDEDELETTGTGTTTPGSHRSSSLTAEPASPAFVPEDKLEAAATGGITLDSSKPRRLETDSALPAFVPQDFEWTDGPLSECNEPVEQGRIFSGGKTLSLTNVPGWYTQSMLLEEIRDSGFRPRDDFDFLYLPLNLRTGLNFNSCLINFVSEAIGNAFEAAFHGRSARLAEKEALPFEVTPTTLLDLEKIYMYQATSPAQQDFPAAGGRLQHKARFCPHCGFQTDISKFNFCAQCGTCLKALRH